MKIRQGFVSNSSSSSFVVAFPKKPKTSNDVFNIMFDGKEGEILDYDNEGVKHTEIANYVFQDTQKAKKVTKKELLELFAQRYCYYPSSSNCHIFNGFNDGRGCWGQKPSRYYASSEKLREEYVQLQIIEEEKKKELNKKEQAIRDRFHLTTKEVPWAYKAKDNSYTEKQIKAYEEYRAKEKIFSETDAEWLAYEKERRDFYNNHFSAERKLCAKLAKEDVENFLKDNKGKFLFIVSYSDNASKVEGVMEHGDIFYNVPCIAISQH